VSRDVGDPPQVRVVELLDALDACHEPRELLELGPLVIRRPHRDGHLDGLADVAHRASRG
jgi:hypothetical protein